MGLSSDSSGIPGAQRGTPPRLDLASRHAVSASSHTPEESSMGHPPDSSGIPVSSKISGTQRSKPRLDLTSRHAVSAPSLSQDNRAWDTLQILQGFQFPQRFQERRGQAQPGPDRPPYREPWMRPDLCRIFRSSLLGRRRQPETGKRDTVCPGERLSHPCLPLPLHPVASRTEQGRVAGVLSHPLAWFRPPHAWNPDPD